MESSLRVTGVKDTERPVRQGVCVCVGGECTSVGLGFTEGDVEH